MLGSKEQRTEGMRRQAQELIDQAYERGFKAGYDKRIADAKDAWESAENEAYQRGLDDAWEAAKKIHVMFYKDIEKIFGKPSEHYVYSELSASEAIAKIKEFEEKQKKAETDEIMIGDEVIGKFGFFRGVVVGIDLQSQKASVLNVGYQLPQTYSLNCIDRTTGRHFSQILEVLEQLEGE